MESVQTPAVSDVIYGVTPVVGDLDLGAEGQGYQVIMVNPELLRLLAGGGLTDVAGPAPMDNNEGSTGGGRPEPPPVDTGDPDFPSDGSPAPAFAPQITLNVYGEVSEETVDNMRDSLRDTVRELYEEFRDEELQQMALKNQYSF